MKKLYYLSTVIFPNHRAHGVQIMKTCESFSRSFEVTLFAGRLRREPEEILRYYCITRSFALREIGALRGRFKIFSDIRSAFRYARLMRKDRDVLYYTRDRFMAFILSFFHKNFFCEIHSLPPHSKFLIRRLGYASCGLISTNSAKKETMVSWGIPAERILVAPNGVDLSLFDAVEAPPDQLRDELDLPRGKILIGFIGRFEQRGESKGAHILFEVIKQLENPSIIFCFIGGTRAEIETHQAQAREYGIAEQCVWREAVSFEFVPRYIKAMDVLFLAHKKTPHLSYYASAVKVFEYMAAERPIVVSRSPAIQEVLPEDAAFYFKPEDAADAVRAIRMAVTNREEARLRATRARKQATLYTWEERAARISKFLESVA